MKKELMNMKKEQRFAKEVIAKMAKAGIDCRMENNKLVIEQDGKRFGVNIWKTPGWGKHRVHFTFEFGFAEMKTIQPRGLAWLASECNNHSEYTTTQFVGDHFACRVETTARSAKEFVGEYEFAFKQIGQTFTDIVNNLPTIQESFGKKPTRNEMGFLAVLERQRQENEEACKMVAQTEDNFAA